MKNILVLMSLFLSNFTLSAQKSYSESSILMGSSFEITVVALDEDFAKESLAIAKKEITWKSEKEKLLTIIKNI